MEVENCEVAGLLNLTNADARVEAQMNMWPGHVTFSWVEVVFVCACSGDF